ncbi:hypothetical protein PFISCL1PPCAC_16551, partial [Pristionchus fissidentatus]
CVSYWWLSSFLSLLPASSMIDPDIDPEENAMRRNPASLMLDPAAGPALKATFVNGQESAMLRSSIPTSPSEI